MEFVPFAFCESVALRLSNDRLQKLKPICAKLWKTAVAEMIEQRMKVCIILSLSNGQWSYHLEVKESAQIKYRIVSFAELKKCTRRMHVKRVLIGSSSAGKTSATFEEITEIVQFAIPLLYRAALWVLGRRASPNCADEYELTRILSFYQDSFIAMIIQYRKSVDEFLKNQLKSANSLVRLTLSSMKRSEGVRLMVEEFAITKPFRSLKIISSKLVFDRAFFERLFEKTLTGQNFGKTEFEARFSFKFRELRTFKPEIQDVEAAAQLPTEGIWLARLSSKLKHIVWRRNDGVQITATYVVEDKRWIITFE